jgi:uncharacterized OB-fold protein
MTMEKPRPRPTPATQPFWDALTEERLRVPRCDDCGGWVFYPRVRCHHCLSDHLTWCDTSAEGTLYTFTISRQATAPPFADEVPQVLAVVETADGIRLTTTLVDADEATLRVGMAVAPLFEHGADGVTLLRYRPAET